MAAIAPHRTQEERSSTTRKKLAKAAFELIRDKGYASFRVAFVAKSCGVSQGCQLHHFPTKDTMTFAAIEHCVAEAEKTTQRHFARYTQKANAVEAITNDSRDYYFSANFDVAMDVSKSSSANPQLGRSIARITRKYRDRVEKRWGDILIDRGWSERDAKDLVAMTASLVRGFAIRAMIRPDRGETGRLMKRWADMVDQTFDIET